MPDARTPLHLPEDVWLNIFERHLAHYTERQQTIRILASTCKRLHHIATPALYHTLCFSFGYDGRQPYVALSFLFKACKRVQSLQRSPHLLQFVRELHLEDWWEEDWTRFYTWSDGNDDDDDEVRHHVCGLWALAYDAVAGLVLKMPQLKSLTLFDSAITPHLQRSIASSPLLTLLDVINNFDTTPIQTSMETSMGCHLRHFEYSRLDPYFSHILQHCTFTLTTLSVEPCQVLEVSAWASNFSLSLQTLTIRHGSLGTEGTSALSNILSCCCKLRVLRLYPIIPDEISLDLASHVLPKLHTISCQPSLVRAFTEPEERVVTCVEICGDITLSFNGLFTKSAAACVEKLSLSHGHWLTFQELVALLRPTHPFKSVTHLHIYNTNFDDWTKLTLDIKEIRDAFSGALHLWPRLRTLHIRHTHRGYPLFDPVCPVAAEYTPSDRGHPSLEEITFSNHFAQVSDGWRWVRGRGWVRGRETSK